MKAWLKKLVHLLNPRRTLPGEPDHVAPREIELDVCLFCDTTEVTDHEPDCVLAVARKRLPS